MSNINNEEINEEENSAELITEEEAERNILSFKTARYLSVFLVVVVIFAFVISFVDFKRKSDAGEHVKYLFMEMNIPKGYPDTVYVSKIVYMDTSKVIHDTIYKDDPRPVR